MSGVFSHLSPDLPSLSSQALLSRFQKPHSGADLPRLDLMCIPGPLLFPRQALLGWFSSISLLYFNWAPKSLGDF